jgi:hypothetical protein
MPFIETEDSQEPITGPYPKLDESRPNPYTLLLWDQF